MARIPTPRSFSQILGNQIGTFLSKTGLHRLKIGNPILSIFESTSQSQLRSSGDIFKLLNSANLDSATGEALRKIGRDENVLQILAKSSNGFITIIDSSFTKIASEVYQGTAAPIVGSVTINVADASAFPSSGEIYISRNTNNYEGPIAYASKVDNVAYWTLNLSTPTTKYHNLGESVIVSQGGNRTISAGTIVKTVQASLSSPVQFKTNFSSTIPDGETQVSNVFVVCTKTGLAGNVGSNTITTFSSVPFSGAICTNPSPFTNGREIENEDEYRERIRKARQTRALATKLAIQQAAINVFSPDENKTVSSSSYETRIGEPDVLYIDDGTGYEELPIPINYDTLVAFASGGEQFLQLNSPTPITKAFVQTNNSAPYNLSEGQTLSVLVSGQLSEHSFSSNEFININGATAYEVVSAINGNPSLKFTARTGSGGTKVVIFAKTNIFEDIKVITNTNDANDVLGFASTPQSTLKLYKNDELLVKDGAPAIFYSNSFYVWTNLSGIQTLEIGIDNTPALVFSITDADFVDANTGYSSLGNNSLTAWATVLNAKIPGITFTVTGSMLSLQSNLGNNSTAQIDILGGTLVSSNMFTVGTVNGVNSDYIFDRNIGQLKLTIPLTTGDTVTASSFFTNAFVQSDAISTANLATNGKLWLGLDMGGYDTVIVPLASGSSLAISHASTTPNYAYRIRISSTSNVFTNVLIGDLVIISDENIDISLHGSWRVAAVGSTFIDIDKINCTSERGYYPVGVLLNDNRFFVCGGSLNGYPTNTAEIYDNATETWTAVPPMSYARSGHTATLLADGRVLVAGGFTTVKTTVLATGIPTISVSIPTNTAEIYDPGLNTWSAAANMANARVFHSAGLIIGGPNIDKVLVAGGENSAGVPYSSCELYDPGANSWAGTGALATARSHCAACVLVGAGSGDILLAGGADFSTATVFNSAERYSIAAGTWSAAGTFTTARFDGNMVNNTSNGKAEMFGGINATVGGSFQTALSRYDIAGNTWAAGTSAPQSRAKSAWIICNNNKIVSIGGNGSAISNSTALVYDSGADTWSGILAAPSGHNVEGSVGAQVAANLVVASHGSISITDFLTTTQKPAASAVSYLFDAASNTFSYTDPSIVSSVSLLNGGIKIARTIYAPQYIEIPSGATYTASSLVSEINSDIVGASAITYKTNQIRISTNTDDVLIGGIGLIGANASGQQLLIDIGAEIQNLTGHVGSVESETSEISTVDEPALLLDGTAATNWLNVLRRPEFNPLQLSENLLFGEQFARLQTNNIISNYSAARWFYSQINSQQNDFSVELDQISSTPLAPGSVIHAMLPYVFSAYDTLSVLIDGDSISKSYNVNMFRNLQTQGTTYSTTNVFKDADNSNNSLAVAFGFGSNGFAFDNFALHMAARTKAHPADVSKRILYRFNKLGPDGNYCLLEYALPDGPSSAIQQSVIFADEDSNNRDIIQIKLAGGAAATGIQITSNAKIGVAATVISADDTATVVYAMGLSINNAVRTTNVTTLTVTLPPNITDHGIPNGSGIWFTGSGSFVAGFYAITGVTANTVSYSEVGADVAPTAIVATISLDTLEDTMQFASPAVATGRFFKLNGGTTISSPTQITDRTMRIISTGNQYVEGKFRGNVTPQSTTLSWYPIIDRANWIVFANSGNTAGTIAAAITGTGVHDAVTATLVGTGAGVINQATFEEANDSQFYYELTDGIQYVESVSIPGTVVGDYSFTFKGDIATDLASNSDWANESVRLVPVTTQNCVDWLGSTSVSGLGSVASVDRSTRGTKVQISTNTIGSIGSVKISNSPANQVICPIIGPGLLQGDSFTLYAKKSLTQTLVAGSKVLVQNSLPLTKAGPLAILPANTFFSGGNGLVGSTTVILLPIIRNSFTSSISFEKISDKLCIVSGWALGGPANFNHDGGWVYIDRFPLGAGTQVSSTNQGLFRIVQAELSQGQGGAGVIDSGFLVIENPNAVDENRVSCVINSLWDSDSLVLPGDYFSVNSDIVAGSANVGKRQVVSVGKAYAQVPAGGMSRTTNVVTVNTPYWHGLRVGDTFHLSPGEPLFPEGDYLVATTPNFFQFTYSDIGSDGVGSTTQYVDGFDFQSPYIFRLDTQGIPVQDAQMVSANGGLTNISEGTPQAVVKRILGISPSQTQDSASLEELMAIKLHPANNASASTRIVHAGEHAGTSIIPLGKFEFPTNTSVGLDGYHYSGGLIGELSKVLYGVESNPISYPGILAGGTSLGISGPLVKRILVDLAIRLKVGVMPSLVINKVKSAVAAAINKTAVGEDIALSDLIEAANQVVGVVSVVLKSPTYNLSNDVIKVQTYEKALILDVANDIKVSLLGD